MVGLGAGSELPAPSPVCPELVEGPLFSSPYAPSPEEKDGPSTSSGRTGERLGERKCVAIGDSPQTEMGAGITANPHSRHGGSAEGRLPVCAPARRQGPLGAFRIPRRVPGRPSGQPSGAKTPSSSSSGFTPRIALPASCPCVRMLLGPKPCEQPSAGEPCARLGNLRFRQSVWRRSQPRVGQVRALQSLTRLAPEKGSGPRQDAFSNLPRSTPLQGAGVHELAVRTSLALVLRLLRSVMPHFVRRA